MNTIFSNRAAIVGTGYTEFSKESGVSTTTLAARAILSALLDAGLTIDDVDGLASFSVGDSISPTLLARVLGIPDLSYYLHQMGGGSASHTTVAEAAMACITGQAQVVVCYRSLNDRSGHRFGQRGVPLPDPQRQFLDPSGCVSPMPQFAFAARAHMNRFGTKSEDFGRVAIAQREFAGRNDRAMMRQPLTMDEYLDSPWIAEPLRRFDCCLETDGACAVVVTTTSRAKDLRQHPIAIRGAAWGPGHTRFGMNWEDLTESGAKYMAPRLFGQAGVHVGDIDTAALYDACTFMVLVQLEDYGFCGKGEAGEFVASGATSAGGSLPVNTHGGLLSEGYIHGLNHVCEVVSQLRGSAGGRQVPGAKLGLSTGEAGMLGGHTSALVLERL